MRDVESGDVGVYICVQVASCGCEVDIWGDVGVFQCITCLYFCDGREYLQCIFFGVS